MQGQDGRTPEQREIDLLKMEVAKQNNLRAHHPMEAANPGYAISKDNPYWHGPARDETPDHLTVSGMVDVLANDARKLVEEIGELRARLSPLLSEQKTPPVERRPAPSARCKMADEMAQVQLTLQQAHEMVYLTLAQLDL